MGRAEQWLLSAQLLQAMQDPKRRVARRSRGVSVFVSVLSLLASGRRWSVELTNSKEVLDELRELAPSDHLFAEPRLEETRLRRTEVTYGAAISAAEKAKP